MDQRSFEAQLYDQARRLLKTHDTLLRDGVRNRAFYNALERTVTPDSMVLDIGAGSGIWAITAAKMGAKRAIAIDMDELMIGVIRLLAKEHGVSDRVEAIWGSSFNVELGREFDIVVSETIGYVGYDENIVAVMSDARSRFSKPGGRLIPETVELYAAPAHLDVRKENVPAGMPFEFDGLRQLDVHSPRVLKRLRDAKLLARPKCLVSTDLYKASEIPPLDDLRADWDIEDATAVNCFIVWVESQLTKGVRLSTRRTTSWLPGVYPAEPPARSFSKVGFHLSLSPVSVSWSAEFSGEAGKFSRSYSPRLAAEKMLASARREISGPKESAPKISLRPATAEDEDLLRQIYFSTRRDEVAAFGWDEAQQNAFLDMQFRVQQGAYKIQSAGASHAIIMYNDVPAGRMIVDRCEKQILLTDIAVLPDFRKHGIATRLILELQTEAAAAKLPLVLQVDKSNFPAFRLYEKLGFAATGESEFTIGMEWKPKTTNAK